MTVERIVVGAEGDDAAARTLARSLRDAGHEVVLVGGHQSAEQLARTAVAEDATRIVVDGAPEIVARVAAACADLGAGDITVSAGR